MVSKWWMRRMHAGHRKKRAASTENLRRIERPGPFTNFQRIKPNAITCDLSRTVNWDLLRDRSQQVGKKRVAGCFFCCAWRSGWGWCSCCCRGTRPLNRKNSRRSAPRKLSRPRPRSPVRRAPPSPELPSYRAPRCPGDAGSRGPPHAMTSSPAPPRSLDGAGQSRA